MTKVPAVVLTTACLFGHLCEGQRRREEGRRLRGPALRYRRPERDRNREADQGFHEGIIRAGFVAARYARNSLSGKTGERKNRRKGKTGEERREKLFLFFLKNKKRFSFSFSPVLYLFLLFSLLLFSPDSELARMSTASGTDAVCA